MWEIVRKSFDKNEIENLTTLLKLDYLKFFWNYLDMNYVFQSNVTCEFMWFNTMPCVIFRWSPDLVSVVFVTTESNQGQCPSLWMTRSSLLSMEGRGSLIVYGWGCCPWSQETTCKRGPIWRALSAAHGERGKPWGYGWGCCPWGQESAYQRGQYHASSEWVDPLTGLCGSMVYLC